MPHVRKSGLLIPVYVLLMESWALELRLNETGIPLTVEIPNPNSSDKNPESSTRNPNPIQNLLYTHLIDTFGMCR